MNRGRFLRYNTLIE